MLREFSKELVEDRQFEIGGELFYWRYPFWEEYANLRQRDTTIAEDAMKQTNGASETGGKEDDKEDDKYTFIDLYKEFIDRIEMFLDPKNDSIKRWRALAKRKVDPVPAYQYSELYQWLVEVTSARPTETLLSSLNGQERTADTSTEGSS